jgi:Domain of unknown function (DUF222)
VNVPLHGLLGLVATAVVSIALFIAGVALVANQWIRMRRLQAGAGRGLTGGATLLPMSDVIRLASHAHHYLCIFDKGRAFALYHTKRLASPGQRIVLYANTK